MSPPAPVTSALMVEISGLKQTSKKNVGKGFFVSQLVLMFIQKYAITLLLSTLIYHINKFAKW